MAKAVQIEVWNPNRRYRVVSIKPMPETRCINLLIEKDCRVEICTQKKKILSIEHTIALLGDKFDGVIGQLTKRWGETLFMALSRAGGKAFSNMAVGYNHVDVNAANKYGVAVGNVLGVLTTTTTSELAVSLTLAAARRIVEADEFMRTGFYDGWLPHLFVGNLLKGQTDGVIVAVRIGFAYGRIIFLKAHGEQPVRMEKSSNSGCGALGGRGPVVDEVALLEDLKQNPMFCVGRDVFEAEPCMKPGLADMKNGIVVPYTASASKVPLMKIDASDC